MQCILDLVYGQFRKEVKLALNPFASFNASMSSDDFNELVKCAKEVLIMPIVKHYIFPSFNRNFEHKANRTII